MTSSEFTDWVAYYGIEPWGSEIDGLRQGYTASVIFNTVASAVGSKSTGKDLSNFTIGVRHTKGLTNKEEKQYKLRINYEKLKAFGASRGKNAND